MSQLLLDDKPLVSIAMCTYNGERFIAQQMQSILDQTYSNLEIVVADDVSSDGTISILRRFQQLDSRIRIIENDKNLGFVRNFQHVLQECKGDYIALADQDDVWLPSKIATMYEEIGDNLLLYSSVSLIDDNGHMLPGEFPRANRIDGRCGLSLILGNCVTGHACLIRAELLKLALPIPEGLWVHDQWLAIVAGSTGRMKASSQVLSLYRKHDNNAILGKNKRQRRLLSKREKNTEKTERLIMLIGCLLKSGLFVGRDRSLLMQFHALLKNNRNVFYNRRLASFLKSHQDVFLLLYRDKKKVIKKICRGDWYYRLMPFT